MSKYDVKCHDIPMTTHRVLLSGYFGSRTSYYVSTMNSMKEVNEEMFAIYGRGKYLYFIRTFHTPTKINSQIGTREIQIHL